MTTSSESPLGFVRPLLRVLELFRSDSWHLGREKRAHKVEPLSNEEEQWITTRDGPFLDFTERYLEDFNKHTWDSYSHIVQKTVTLAGWFGILFVAISLPMSLMKDSIIARPKEWPWSATLLFGFALFMFVLSLFGVCRVLWRMQYKGDATRWIANGKFATGGALRTERILELILRIPENQSQVAVKARLYQGAVWSFFFAVLFEICGIGVLFTAHPLTPETPHENVRLLRPPCAALPPVPASAVSAVPITSTPSPAATERQMDKISPKRK